MSNNFIRCVKCRNNAELDRNIYRNEYTCSHPIRDKDGQIYCWDCYKNKSHCKGCQKSVANMKFSRSGQPTYPHCTGGVSYNCERIDNKVEFICSKKCSEKLADQEYQTWKDKLNQGWTKCEACVKFWIDGESNKKGWKWLKEERQHSRFIKLLPPEKKGVCDCCEPYEKDGYYHKIHQKAQEHWNSLSYEEKLSEVIKTNGVRMAKFYGQKLTAEELAKQEKVPRSIYEEFVHSQKCHSCGEEPCKYNKKDNNNSSCSSVRKKWQRETQKTNTKSNLSNFLDKKSNALIFGGIIVISSLLLATKIFMLMTKKSKNK